MLVLVVEDDENHRKFIKEALTEAPPEKCSWRDTMEQRGMEYNVLSPDAIVEVTNRDEAIDKLKGTQIFDLLILDLLIPESPRHALPDPDILLGFEVLKFVRHRDFKYYLPVVIFSGNVNPAKPGYTQLQRLIDSLDVPAPDEVLAKTEESTHYRKLLAGTMLAGETAGAAVRWDRELFQRKVAPFLVDLTSTEETTLEKSGVFIPGNATRRVLRQLKRLARSTPIDKPLPDVILLGKNGVGKTTFAKAYHVLRRHNGSRLAFHSIDLGSLDVAGSAPNLTLFGGTNFEGNYSLGAFVKCTCYKRSINDSLQVVRFTGGLGSQEFETGAPPANRTYTLGPTLYPAESDKIDFEASGTLFLDEVVNIQPEIQKMLLQAIGYNLEQRFVHTTGTEYRRVPVGPALVFATRKDIDEHREAAKAGNDDRWSGALDYLYRIDQARVTIPPLVDRREEIVPILERLVHARTGISRIVVDSTVQEMFDRYLRFENNVADLRRIADQVTPEDHSITWRHVKGVWERENPGRRVSTRATESVWGVAECEAYLSSVEQGKTTPTNLSYVWKTTGTTQRSVYGLALHFLDSRCGGRWPLQVKSSKFFAEKPAAFKQAFRRMREHWVQAGTCDLDTLKQDITDFRAGTLKNEGLESQKS